MLLRDIFSSLSVRCDKFEHYFPLYERYLGHFRNKAPRILEIGVRFGGSAKMWTEYFGPGTEIVGVDIAAEPGAEQYLDLVAGDQGSAEFWDSFAETHGKGGFDIIMDDGSHENAHQILTLKKVFPLLRDGGVFLCEDVHTSYYHGVRVQGGGYRNPASFMEFAKKIADVINEKHTRYAIGVGPTPKGPHVDAAMVARFDRASGLHVHDSMVVIETAALPTLQRVNADPSVKFGPKGNPQPADFQ